MPGTKRKASFRTPYERPSKLAKRTTSATTSGPVAKMMEISASAPASTDDLPSPPGLRRASTLTLEDVSDVPKATVGKKRSLTAKPTSLSKKSSSFVEEGALVTRLSKTKSGSIIGETSVVATGLAKTGSTAKSLSTKKSSVRSSEGSKMPSIPSGLTKLALPSSGSKGGSLIISKSTLVADVDETEMSSALASLKSTLSKEKSTTSVTKKSSIRSTLSKRSSSVRSTLSKKGSTKSTSGAAEELMDTSASGGAGLPPGGLMELAISFDTTGSMYGCLEEVRAKVQDLVQRLQADIPGIRISIIAHGDYCDEHSSYLIKWIDFGASLPEICDFVKGVGRTGGGDGPECYELVLQRTREVLSWTTGSQRALIMIGDNLPHEPGYRYGGKTYHINWRDECTALRDMGVKVYTVQAKGGFGGKVQQTYDEMARITGGRRVELNNFSSMFDFIMMICYREANPDMMTVYEQEMRDRSGRLAEDVNALTKTLNTDAPPAPAGGRFGPPGGFPGGGGLFGGLPAGGMFGGFGAAKPKKAPKVKKGLKAKTKATTKAAKVKAIATKTTREGEPIKTTKKAKQLKIDKVLKREKLPDSCMNKGALGSLTWSKWVKVVTQNLPDGKKEKKQFIKARTLSGYTRKTWFNEGFNHPAVYEFAVQAPTKRAGKKYVVYCRITRRGFNRGGSWCSNLIRHKTVRKEANRVLGKGCSIFVRRGVPSGKIQKGDMNKQIMAASDYIRDNLDYAWKKYIWRKTKTGNLCHRQLKITRKGVPIMLSEQDI